MLAGKQPNIGEGSLAQSKVQNLTSDLAAKASTQQLTDAIATREPVIQDGSLTIARTSNLQQALDERAKTADVNLALATRQPLLTQESGIAVDAISSRLFLGDVFIFWKTDQSGSLLTLSDNALGAEFTTPIRAPSLLPGSYCGIGTSTLRQH